jgi:hypothetical protein
MWMRQLSGKPSVTVVLTSLTLFASSARAQDSQSAQSRLESEVMDMRADNRAIRQELRKLEEQQKTILQLMDELRHRLDGGPAAAAHQSPPAPQPDSAPAAQATVPPKPAPATQTSADRNIAAETPYEDSIVLVKTPESARIPILLRFWDISQLRYTNSQLGNSSYTDHLGADRPVTRRNDFSLNRNMFQFTGYIFDKRLNYNLIIWASNTSAAVVIGGFVSWRFNRSITLYSGYWGAPGSRTLTGSFPYFVQPERSMADQFFRPGFTQGAWIDGEPLKGFHYELFVGDGLNTLTVPTGKIDPHLVYSGSVWWEPLGVYGIPGTRARSMYDDYESHKKPVVRFGTSATKSKENRFSQIQEGNPENTGLFNSDGVNTFATGAFAPGVTVSDVTYRMLAADAGVKWRGLSVNGQYFFRWLNRFRADGPIPVTSTFDHGFETVVGAFVVPKKWELYGRASFVFGQFRNSYEYAPGVKWYPLRNHRVYVVGEGLRIVKSPVSSIITPYNSGFTGWSPMLQWMFNF